MALYTGIVFFATQMAKNDLFYEFCLIYACIYQCICFKPYAHLNIPSLNNRFKKCRNSIFYFNLNLTHSDRLTHT